MDDPKTLWLNLTNIALGLVVLVCIAVVAYGVLQEFALRRKKRAAAFIEIDRDMKNLAAAAAHDDHAFHLPELGLTMADGGERTDAPERVSRRKK
ncbi:MAG: hypothetical protein HUU41_12815 [Bryobacteraceae bacterium]|nr:hypothetical protein [Bryobacterales bacterium]MEB2362017.1 hypothetical protein [Bryobacterales bacterium]NUN01990.1 hypothetical protein [Bryobacteraceae bacterium]